MIDIRPFFFLGLLLLWTQLSADPHEEVGEGYLVRFEGVEFLVPKTYLVDLTFAAHEFGSVILREVGSGEETGGTIGLASFDSQDDPLEALKGLGYTESRLCGFRLFSNDQIEFGPSVVIDLGDALIDIGDVSKKDRKLVLSSICNLSD